MSGTQLGQLLVKTNPHQDKECDREDCFPCRARPEDVKGSTKCRKEGVTYSLECNICPKEEPGIYIGETSSTAFIRGREHKNQYRLFKEGKVSGKDSVIGRHQVECHNSDHSVTDFSMRVWNHYLGSTHQRQVNEKVLIDQYATINTRTEMGTDLATQHTLSMSRSVSQLPPTSTRGRPTRGRRQQK